MNTPENENERKGHVLAAQKLQRHRLADRFKQ
jgi:hypothetical protein